MTEEQPTDAVETRTADEIMSENVEFINDFVNSLPVEYHETRRLMVLVGAYIDLDRKAVVPQEDLNSALIVAISGIERRLMRIEQALGIKD